LFGKFFCGLWAEEYGIENFNEIKNTLKKNAPQKKKKEKELSDS
jgi:hypothetical protein